EDDTFFIGRTQGIPRYEVLEYQLFGDFRPACGNPLDRIGATISAAARVAGPVHATSKYPPDSNSPGSFRRRPSCLRMDRCRAAGRPFERPSSASRFDGVSLVSRAEGKGREDWRIS